MIPMEIIYLVLDKTMQITFEIYKIYKKNVYIIAKNCRIAHKSNKKSMV